MFRSAQSLLNSLCSVSQDMFRFMATNLKGVSQSFDGVRRRCIPQFLKNIAPGMHDDRVKGALWSLNMQAFGKGMSKSSSLVFLMIEQRNMHYLRMPSGLIS